MIAAIKGLVENLLARIEGVIDPFGDTTLAVLPKRAGSFIAYFAGQAKGPFIAAFLVGGLTGAVDAGLYWSLGWLIDILEGSDRSTLFADHWPALTFLLFIVLFGRALALVASVVIEQILIVSGFFTRVRWQSFKRVIEQPYAFYQNDFAGRIATKVMQGGQATGDFITMMLQTFWTFITFVVLTVSIFITLDFKMVLVVVLWLVAYVLIGWKLLPRVRRYSKAVADTRSITNGRMVDAFTNIMAVKLFDDGKREHQFVREAFEAQLVAARKQVRSIALVRAAVVSISGLMMAGVGILAVNGWLAGTVTTGALATAIGLTFRLSHMSGWIMFSLNGIYRDFATVQDTIGVVSVEPAITDSPDAETVARSKGDIRFDNVTFHYGREGGIIEGLNLHIKPGERVALIGPSGVGKTTIINLLLRLFDVEGGRVLLDGRDVRQVTQASLRAQFGVVSQEPILMHRSIHDNIAYGRSGASREEVIAAAEQAAADGFIGNLTDSRGRTGYDAHVGERGVKLSGGQRQRIAIARVFLKDAPVLILDEATSQLDSGMEAEVQEQLFDLMAGKTVIAIAHRLSTISSFERLIVLDKGKIVEEGNHEELLERQGLYASLWARQSGGYQADGHQEDG